MKKNLYHIDIAPLKNKDGSDISSEEHIAFDFESHDDLKQILSKVGIIEGLDKKQTHSFAIGLKMLGEIMLEHRKHPLFHEFSPHFGQFMKKLKQNIK
ncbi:MULTISPECIES: DUF3861 domain-containing protein [Vibrio]|uniref:DUF3861 family protein n=2 Tax=Vibrio TaxID=662 RepID=A0A7X4LHA6_9VIBR|nr:MULTISPECIES: DUF3861 domain-containing protein [Vibrio]MBF9003211.1 DUF3861 domain-containing protein [Vibrio nitrifigilis]MZI91934.1 DUF3861 family protein [Vibrio eleionomae]